MASLTFTVVARKTRAPRSQRNNTQTGVKVSSSWRRRTTRPHQPRKPKRPSARSALTPARMRSATAVTLSRTAPGLTARLSVLLFSVQSAATARRPVISRAIAPRLPAASSRCDSLVRLLASKAGSQLSS